MSHCLCLPQVSGEKKPVGSTAGMQTSVETSPLLKVGGHGTCPAWAGTASPFPWDGAGGCAVTPKASWCYGCQQIGVTVTFPLWVSPNSG